ncbi:MAG: YdeI/OmpD-associated family protein, partial [Proteobacteria bacterium]|nr:YdeI/OmpD-associated family protein [Pseudomonadota bacterium]
PRVPADLRRLLAGRPRARATYLALPPSGRRDFVDWLTTAKRAATRARRLARTAELLTAGRARDGRPVGRR